MKRRMIGAWMALMITASSLVASPSPAADMSSVSADLQQEQTEPEEEEEPIGPEMPLYEAADLSRSQHQSRKGLVPGAFAMALAPVLVLGAQAYGVAIPWWSDSLQNRALAAGLEVTAGMSPLFPDGDPEQLWIPQAGIALVRQSSQFGTISGAITLDLDPLASPSSQARREAAYLRELTGQILDTAVRQLAKAKAIHDELEAALHPYVDFDGVTRTADGLADDIQRLM